MAVACVSGPCTEPHSKPANCHQSRRILDGICFSEGTGKEVATEHFPALRLGTNRGSFAQSGPSGRLLKFGALYTGTTPSKVGHNQRKHGYSIPQALTPRCVWGGGQSGAGQAREGWAQAKRQHAHPLWLALPSCSRLSLHWFALLARGLADRCLWEVKGEFSSA